jgi:hypothetical protein
MISGQLSLAMAPVAGVSRVRAAARNAGHKQHTCYRVTWSSLISRAGRKALMRIYSLDRGICDHWSSAKIGRHTTSTPGKLPHVTTCDTRAWRIYSSMFSGGHWYMILPRIQRVISTKGRYIQLRSGCRLMTAPGRGRVRVTKGL